MYSMSCHNNSILVEESSISAFTVLDIMLVTCI